MAYFILNSEITIGRFTIKGVNEVTVKESVKEYATSCIITLPTSAVLRTSDKLLNGQTVLTAKQFNVGDKVEVKLGYNGDLRREFVGFVSHPNVGTPAQIECEGYSYVLRKKKNIKKTWATTTLVDVLKEVVKDTDIKLHPKIPKIPLRNLIVNNASGTQVIEYLVELLKGTITACFIDDVLFVGLTYTDLVEQTVKYRVGWNTISADSLKFKKADDVDVKIEFKFKGEDGTPQKGTAQQESLNSLTGGIVRKETVGAVSDATWLKKMAEAKLKQETYDGYEGTVEAFLQPYCRAGYRIELDDPRYTERSGNYFCVGTEVTFGQSGARRTPELGIKLS